MVHTNKMRGLPFLYGKLFWSYDECLTILAILATSGWENWIDFQKFVIKVGPYKKNEGFTIFLRCAVQILWQSLVAPRSFDFQGDLVIFCDLFMRLSQHRLLSQKMFFWLCIFQVLFFTFMSKLASRTCGATQNFHSKIVYFQFYWI